MASPNKITKLWQGVWAMTGSTYRVVLHQETCNAFGYSLVVERRDGEDAMGESSWTRIEYNHPHYTAVTLLTLAATPIEAINAVKAKIDGLALP